MKIGITEILTIIFIGLKFTNAISWSWWWILSPLWITLLLWILLSIIFLIQYIHGGMDAGKLNKRSS